MLQGKIVVKPNNSELTEIAANKPDWHLLQCKPREEIRANLNLKNQGYTTFLPEVKTTKKTKAGYVESPSPLFPGYIFIKLNNNIDNWSPIRSTRGVNKLVTFGLNPAVVPDLVIQNIRQITEVDKTNEHYPFSKGEKITINTGPFKDLQAVFDTRDGQQRAWIFIELMGKWQRIAINDVELNKVA